MPISPYVKGLRDVLGPRLLLMPGVTAVVVDDAGRILLGERADTGRWSLIAARILMLTLRSAKERRPRRGPGSLWLVLIRCSFLTSLSERPVWEPVVRTVSPAVRT